MEMSQSRTTTLTGGEIQYFNLPTLLSLVRVRRPTVLTGVAGSGHGLLGLVGGLLPGLLLAGDGGLGGTQGGQVVPAQAGGQRQRVLQIERVVMGRGLLWSPVVHMMWCGVWYI